MDLCQFGNFATSTIFINFHSFLSLLFNVPMSKHGLQVSKQIKGCSLSLSLSLSLIFPMLTLILILLSFMNLTFIILNI